MKKTKGFFREKLIISAVMCILLGIVLIMATYGWYVMHRDAAAYGLKLNIAGNDGIRVAIEPGGEDIMGDPALKHVQQDDKVYTVIPVNLLDFSNIQEQMIAPGAYGPLPFYITSLSEAITTYSIKVQLQYDPGGHKITAEQKQLIETMIRDHISIYQTKYEEGGVVKFRDPISYYIHSEEEGTAAEGTLTPYQEEPVELYWVWNYELTDIPGYQSLKRFPTYNKTGLSETDAVVRSAVRQYDEEDTTLGNYLQDIRFEIYIEGGQGRSVVEE